MKPDPGVGKQGERTCPGNRTASSISALKAASVAEVPTKSSITIRVNLVRQSLTCNTSVIHGHERKNASAAVIRLYTKAKRLRVVAYYNMMISASVCGLKTPSTCSPNSPPMSKIQQRDKESIHDPLNLTHTHAKLLNKS